MATTFINKLFKTVLNCFFLSNFNVFTGSPIIKDYLEDLCSILTPNELHRIKVLIENVKLRLKIRKETSESFETKLGILQGDCLSPILFTLYPAKNLKEPDTTTNHQDHTYDENFTEERNTSLPPYLQDHTYS